MKMWTEDCSTDTLNQLVHIREEKEIFGLQKHSNACQFSKLKNTTNTQYYGTLEIPSLMDKQLIKKR